MCATAETILTFFRLMQNFITATDFFVEDDIHRDLCFNPSLMCRPFAEMIQFSPRDAL